MASVLDKLKGLSQRRKVGRFCAVDFDSRQLRLVQAEAGGGPTRILKVVTADMPDGIDLGDSRAVGEFLGRTLDRMQLAGTPVLMNVPRGKAVLKPLVLPPVSGPAELANMVRFQAEKELTFRPEEAVIDFTIESHYGAEPGPEGEPQGEHVLVAAVQRPVLEYYQQVAGAAGVRLLRLGLRPYAHMRCIEAYGGTPARGCVVIVHVGPDETEIDVMEGGGLTFSRSADIEVPPPVGVNEPITGEAVARVVQEVVRSLHSYMGVQRGQKIDAVLLAGGTGIETQVAEALATQLGAPCEILDLSVPLGLHRQTPGISAFISALGLAVAQGDAGAPVFDFLNPRRAPVERNLTKVVVAGAVAAVVLAVVSTFAGGAWYWYSAGREVARLTAELAVLTEQNKKVAALAKHVSTVETWVQGGRGWLDQWAYLSGVFPSCTDAYATGLSSNPDGSLKFSVKLKHNEAITDLGKRLGDAGYEFKPGQVTTGSDRYGYGYSTSVKVMVDPEMDVNLADLSAVPRPDDDVSAEKFGQAPPQPVPAASGPAAVAPAAPAAPAAAEAPAGVSPYEAWRVKYEAFLKERPPPDQVEAVNAWRARREVLRNEKPPQTPTSSDTRYPNGRFEGGPPQGRRRQ